MNNFCFGKDAQMKDLGGGVSRAILAHNDELMLCHLHFEKGAVGAPHTHHHSQITYIISGVFEFTINGEKKVVRKGDSMYDNPDVLHGCQCLEEGDILDIFTPERKEFLL